MPTNTHEFESGHDDETIDAPLDGRDSQPVAEGSSDDPRTLEALDPLRDAELLAADASDSGSTSFAGNSEEDDDNSAAGDARSDDSG